MTLLHQAAQKPVEASLSAINEAAKVYASGYASPHHITFTVEGLRNLIAALQQQPEPVAPFWYAVVSDEAPIINKAIRRADVAEEYAQNCRENGYRRVQVVPLYTAPPALQHQEVPREPVALTDKQIQDAVFAVLRKWNTDRAWERYTRESGPYDVSSLRPEVLEIIRAVLAASPSTTRQQEVGSRKQLTEEQIILATEHISMERPGVFVYVARAIERAHGIGVAASPSTTRQQEVGREPTSEQMMAGYAVACSFKVYEAQAFKLAEEMYRAMLAAAPSTPENAGGVEGKCECGLSEAACRDPLRRSCPDGVQEVHRG